MLGWPKRLLLVGADSELVAIPGALVVTVPSDPNAGAVVVTPKPNPPVAPPNPPEAAPNEGVALVVLVAAKLKLGGAVLFCAPNPPVDAPNPLGAPKPLDG